MGESKIKKSFLLIFGVLLICFLFSGVSSAASDKKLTSNTAGQFSPAIYNNYDLFNIGTGKTSAAATSKGEDCSSHNSRFLIYMNLLSNYTYFDYVNEIEITIPVFAVLDTGGYSLNSTYTFRFRTTGD